MGWKTYASGAFIACTLAFSEAADADQPCFKATAYTHPGKNGRHNYRFIVDRQCARGVSIYINAPVKLEINPDTEGDYNVSLESKGKLKICFDNKNDRNRAKVQISPGSENLLDPFSACEGETGKGKEIRIPQVQEREIIAPKNRL